MKEKHSLEEAYDMLQDAYFLIMGAIEEINDKDKNEFIGDGINVHALSALQELQNEIAGAKMWKDWAERQDKYSNKKRNKMNRTTKEKLR